MTRLFNYKIAVPTNNRVIPGELAEIQIEISVVRPDTAAADFTGVRKEQIAAIQFQIPTVGAEALTRDPVTTDPGLVPAGGWTVMSEPGEGIWIFTARPPESAGPGVVVLETADTLTLTLPPVRVVAQRGQTPVAVTEIYTQDVDSGRIVDSENFLGLEAMRITKVETRPQNGPLFTYLIQPPTNVIECSTSTHPDDASKANIRFQVTNESGHDIPRAWINEIQFEIKVAGKGNEDDKALEAALTRYPDTINPAVFEFGEWTFDAPGEKHILIATPNATDPTDVVLPAGDSITLILNDVWVVDREGPSQVVVTEVYPDPNQLRQTDLKDMRIRKFNPALRIDYFRANKYATTRAQADPLTLSWATTSAHTVALFGPDGKDILNQGEGDVAFEHVTDNGKPIDTEFKDAEIKLKSSPETTSTYTLIAKGNADDLNKAPIALQQLTITITDQIKTSGKVDAGQITANSVTAGDVSITNGSITAGDVSITDGSITVGTVSIGGGKVSAFTFNAVPEGKIFTDTLQSRRIDATDIEALNNINATGGLITGRGAVPFGTIVMWSGPRVPAGWVICDGRTRELTNHGDLTRITLPNLSQRADDIPGISAFIMFVGFSRVV
jgi:hypothetical protein